MNPLGIIVIIVLILVGIVATSKNLSASDTTIPIDSSKNSTQEDLTNLGIDSILDSSTIYQYAYNAGFRDNDLNIAVAIALAESNGKISAYNPELSASGGTPEGLGSYGLWQIYLKKHPEFSNQNLYDPQTNANAAFKVYSVSGFKPWSTYNNNSYQNYM